MSDTPYNMLPPGDVEPMCEEECRELNAHNQWRMKDQFEASLQAMDWWRQHNRGNQLELELRKESRRLDWLMHELDGWDRDNIDDAIDREETEELKREKLEADAKYDINWEVDE